MKRLRNRTSLINGANFSNCTKVNRSEKERLPVAIIEPRRSPVSILQKHGCAIYVFLLGTMMFCYLYFYLEEKEAIPIVLITVSVTAAFGLVLHAKEKWRNRAYSEVENE